MYLKKNLLSALLILVLLLCLVVYWPGLAGGFLFDDDPNLSPLGAQGGIIDWGSFRSFVFNGFSGPLGRPIALGSFVLDGQNWPTAARPFKLTNLWIHILTGVALGWATLNLLRVWGVEEGKSRWGALLNMAMWLLHPYMVSTTLYVVQRMAQLAAMFMFAGLAGYLHGRIVLAQGRVKTGYLWMSGSLILGTLLAAFSKENGLLLPLLVVTVEFCQPRLDSSLAFKRVSLIWQVCFLWLPSLAVCGALLREINFDPNAWPTRLFNQQQRLLTEPRIIWEYLYHLYVPRIEGRGLFQDGYVISTGWLHPASTWVSVVALLVVITGAIWVRHKRPCGPYIALAVLFFFAAHLMESSVIGLELYFEHRNYVAAAFLFLPLAMALLWLVQTKSRAAGGAAIAMVLVLLTGMTWERAKLWSNTEALQDYWAVATPNSPRAQHHLAMRLLQRGEVSEAVAFLDKSMAQLPNSSLLSIQWLLTRVQTGLATEADFKRIRQLLPRQSFDAQAVLGMRVMAEYLSDSGSMVYKENALAVLDDMGSMPRYQHVSVFQRLLPYLRGMLLLGLGKIDEATEQFELAIQLYGDTEAALSMMSAVANAGYPQHGLRLLQSAKEVYQRQTGQVLKRPRAVYDMEFQRLEAMLREDIGA
ncbi:tetratricopeptide repeat protein [Comamonas sp. JUb58]|uniref:tetratricopeptide repeat protein n=1 Tax=Comamonas sp. JUb58 TaxID=2485114 RepID=UPI00105F72DB|nr:tetratricopeptide repeat protein [Comamonas sp. JUb58]